MASCGKMTAHQVFSRHKNLRPENRPDRFPGTMQSYYTPVSAAVAILLAVVTSIHGEREENGEIERIIGGEDAAPGQFPWTVALIYNGQFVCTASIISPNTVLTAAHCLILEGLQQPVELYYGIANVNRSAPEMRIDFASAEIHPDYDSVDNDVAILRTVEPIDLGRPGGPRPVCIASPDPVRYWKATAMGWGNVVRFRFLNESIPEILQYADQWIVDNGICSIFNEGVNQDKICAKGFSRKGFTGICHGDSGGPLVHLSGRKPPVQIGIASYINEVVGCGKIAPGVWTRVSSHYDFIVDKSNDRGSICEV